MQPLQMLSNNTLFPQLLIQEIYKRRKLCFGISRRQSDTCDFLHSTMKLADTHSAPFPFIKVERCVTELKNSQYKTINAATMIVVKRRACLYFVSLVVCDCLILVEVTIRITLYHNCFSNIRRKRCNRLKINLTGKFNSCVVVGYVKNCMLLCAYRFVFNFDNVKKLKMGCSCHR